MEYYVELKDSKKRREIAKSLKVTSAALSMYLNFKRNSPQAKQAREMALKAGGCLKFSQTVSREETIKILDRKGDVEKVITTKN